MEKTKFCNKCEGTDLELLTGMSIGPVWGKAGTIRSYYISRCNSCQHIMNGEDEDTIDGFDPQN